MQYLKEEINNAIQEAAIEEFYINGYKNSSMRNIASAAGITVGNLYRYFKNKESLFDAIIKPVYDNLEIHARKHLDKTKEVTADTIEEIIYQEGKNLSGFMFQFRRELITLIDGAKETKYEMKIKKFINIFIEHGKGHIRNMDKSFSEDIITVLSRSLITAFLEGLLDILKNNTREDIFQRAIPEYLLIFILGFSNTL